MLQVGDSFDRYTIEAFLGEGGMGSVYRAFDPKLHRRVALKVMKWVSPADEPISSARRLLREARAAAAIEHPNAIAIFDLGEVDGVPYVVMELVEGRSLRAYVGDRSVSLDTRLGWIVDVGRALSVAHDRGLVHRDVKPENVMIRDDGVVKVLDFGIARRTQAPVDGAAQTVVAGIETMTQAGVVIGTPFYMAPEQMRGGTVDARADQFAWGVLSFELLTGRLPWGEGRDPAQAIAALFQRAPASARSLDAAISPEVDAALTRAIAREPNARFSSMSEAIEAMRARPAPSRIAAPIAPSTASGVRIPPIAIGVVIGLLALIVVLLVVMITTGRPSAPTTVGAPKTSTKKIDEGPSADEADEDDGHPTPPELVARLRAGGWSVTEHPEREISMKDHSVHSYDVRRAERVATIEFTIFRDEHDAPRTVAFMNKQPAGRAARRGRRVVHAIMHGSEDHDAEVELCTLALEAPDDAQ